MKKRILSLVMAGAMLLGLSFTSMAEQTKYYEGGGITRINFADWEGEQEVVNATMEISGDHYRLRYTGVEDGVNYDIIGVTYSVEENQRAIRVVDYNGLVSPLDDNSFGTYIITTTEEGINVGVKISYMHSSGISIYNDMDIDLVEVKKPTEPEYSKVSSGFTGTAVSDRGDYDLFLAGYFSKELTDGTHDLTASDIASQTVAIVAHHHGTGVNRNMNQSTIEEMTVTVSGGQLVSATIRGRVQTNGGSLDRYTATINN